MFARAHPIADTGKLSLAHATHRITYDEALLGEKSMRKRRSSIFLAAVILPMASQGFFVAGQARADESDKLVNPSTDVPTEWLTKAERTDFRETPRYD